MNSVLLFFVKLKHKMTRRINCEYYFTSMYLELYYFLFFTMKKIYAIHFLYNTQNLLGPTDTYVLKIILSELSFNQ